MKRFSVLILAIILAGCALKEGADAPQLEISKGEGGSLLFTAGDIRFIHCYVHSGQNVKDKIIINLQHLASVTCNEKISAKNIKGTRVIGEEVIPGDCVSREEEWTVEICGKKIVYLIIFKLYPDGDTAFSIFY